MLAPFCAVYRRVTRQCTRADHSTSIMLYESGAESALCCVKTGNLATHAQVSLDIGNTSIRVAYGNTGPRMTRLYCTTVTHVGDAAYRNSQPANCLQSPVDNCLRGHRRNYVNCHFVDIVRPLL